MLIGKYADGRDLSYNEATYTFDIGGTPVSHQQVLEYDRFNQIAWATPELAAWCRTSTLPAPLAVASTAPAPVAQTQIIDRKGAWCPNCRNRDSHKSTSGLGCVFWVFVLVSMGLALIMIPFLPKTWHCHVCGNEWRA